MGGPFKIEIVPSNGKSQVKLDFSVLYISLLLVAGFFIGDLASLLLLSRDFFLFIITDIPVSVIIIFLIGWSMKRTEMRRIKAIFAYKEDDPIESQLSHW